MKYYEMESTVIRCYELLQGVNVEVELSQLVACLPDVFAGILEELPSLLSAIAYYHSFLGVTRGRYVSTWLPW